jgi:phage repressor protein C with HTH and peptisase S24 domain
MLTHKQIWTAIDALAARYGMSPSGLAKAAGLDPTTFNKSKRGAANGKLRWPSTESVSKILAATGASLDDFVALVDNHVLRTRMVPLIGMAQAGTGGYFDDARARRRARLCARDHRRLDAARLSRRRPRRRLALDQSAPRRPRRG